ncbi:MAG TPA: Holliday junction resolvase RuvX [Parafilimonas sp.]|nr:Holliday junction resolvase RuvX [Parafilimonas sp.]
MPRILCIDYGKKRTGIAVTDPLKIIAAPLMAIETPALMQFLKNYFKDQEVELVLIGDPKNWDETDTHATPLVNQFVQRFKKEFPSKDIKMIDERYTSKLAVDAMVAMGMKKKDRQKKENVDQIAATIMLQEYLNVPHS